MGHLLPLSAGCSFLHPPNSLSFLLLPSSLLLLHPEEERLGLDELPPSKLALGKTKTHNKQKEEGKP
jgi:hypothetical protein